MESLAEKMSASLELLANQGATAQDLAEAQRLWAMALEIGAAVEGKLPRGGGAELDISLGAGLSMGTLRALAALAQVETGLQLVSTGTDDGRVIEYVQARRFGATIRAQGSRPVRHEDLEKLLASRKGGAL